MKERRFGRTGHLSTVAIFGSAVLWELEPEAADRTIQMVLDAGVNHFDVAPSYGLAELHLGRWMPDIRNRIFLNCKTMERSADGARAELNRSLDKLGVSWFDLYQLHAVNSLAELDEVTRPGGALEGILKAHDEGLTQHIGITSHGYDTPMILKEALRRFDFDAILFPYNFVMAGDKDYRDQVDELLRTCAGRAVGTQVIKALTKGPWREGQPHPNVPWYEPFSQPEMVQQCVNFALSQPVTGLCTTSSPEVLPLMLQACENLREMDGEEQAALIAEAGQYETLFKPGEQD